MGAKFTSSVSNVSLFKFLNQFYFLFSFIPHPLLSHVSSCGSGEFWRGFTWFSGEQCVCWLTSCMLGHNQVQCTLFNKKNDWQGGHFSRLVIIHWPTGLNSALPLTTFKLWSWPLFTLLVNTVSMKPVSFPFTTKDNFASTPTLPSLFENATSDTLTSWYFSELL